MKQLVLVLVVGTLFAAADNWTRYNGDVVIRTYPRTRDDVEFLRGIQTTSRTLDFWTVPRGVGYPVDIHLKSEDYLKTVQLFNKNNLQYKIKVQDLGNEIRNESVLVQQLKKQQNPKEFDLQNYHPYEEIVGFLEGLAANSSLLSTSVIGTTYEGRDIVMATVSTGSDANKPIIYMDCAVHAREWIASASCVWFINQLATQYGVDPEITTIVDSFDWLIIPVSNPDGYAYTWSTDRLWRKNRVPTESVLNCKGVDFNRNFDSNFGGPGSSSEPCLDTYHGPSAFSEAETRAMRDVLAANRPRVKSSVSIHSYSQLWMSPYGYKYDLPAENEEMLRVMTKGVEALQATYGTQYQFGNHAETIYVASGTTLDYAYETEGIIYAYLIELRDTGDYGFQLPPSEIQPTATETFNGLKAMALAILETP